MRDEDTARNFMSNHKDVAHDDSTFLGELIKGLFGALLAATGIFVTLYIFIKIIKWLWLL